MAIRPNDRLRVAMFNSRPALFQVPHLLRRQRQGKVVLHPFLGHGIHPISPRGSQERTRLACDGMAPTGR
jgi:hypothetical protein